jgi:hypothetical protein
MGRVSRARSGSEWEERMNWTKYASREGREGSVSAGMDGDEALTESWLAST